MAIRDALRRAREFPAAPSTPCDSADAESVHPERESVGPPTTEDVLDMSYEEFVKADLVLHIRSSLLGEDIAIASDERAAKRAWDGVVVYLMEEFCHLYAGGVLNEAALRVLHRLKKQLPESRMTGTHGMRPNKGDTE